MEVEEIIDSFINGNFKQFYNQVQDFGTYSFFNIIYNQVPVTLFQNMVLRYLLSDQK